jgi:hypothetical protein
MSVTLMPSFSGNVFVYKLFDIGHEVDLKKAQGLLGQIGSSEEFKLRRGVRSVVIEEIPLVLNLDNIQLNVGGSPYHVSIVAKLWNFCALSLSFRIEISQPLPGEELLKLTSLLADHEELNEIAKSKALLLIDLLRPAIKNPKLWGQFEEYMVYIDQNLPANETRIEELLKSDFLFQLLAAEPKHSLSHQMRELVSQNKIQYSKNDLVVIDWDSAYIISEGDALDIADVIEFANIQLLELRYYDDLLDRKMSALYREVMTADQTIFNKSFKKLNDEAGQIYLEVIEVIERIDNSFKVVGDVYYARIFRSALDRFRLKEWKSNVDQKLRNLLDVSQLNNGEIHNRRSQYLEIIIIILIAIEVVPFVYNLIAKSLME